MAGETLTLARQYVDIERPKAALDALARAREDELEEAEYWALRARALLQLERYQESSEASVRGLERCPDDVELLDLLALAYMNSGHSKTAGKILQKALASSPENPILLAHAALAAAKDGEFDAARELVAHAMRVAPDLAPVLRVRAQVAYLAGDSSAQKCVDELLELDPEDTTGHALRGNLALRRKKYVSASRAFDEAARLDPEHEELVQVASRTRVAAHPLLVPLRPLWRLGRWKSVLLYFSILILLASVGLGGLNGFLMLGWFGLIALSWVGPPFVRMLQRRKYGGF